jgi:hypothetical protein
MKIGLLGVQITKKKAVERMSERNLILKEILEFVNEERKGTKFKPLTGKALAIKLSHIPTKDLYYTKSVGLDYKKRHGSFSKFLFGSIKVNEKKS